MQSAEEIVRSALGAVGSTEPKVELLGRLAILNTFINHITNTQTTAAASSASSYDGHRAEQRERVIRTIATLRKHSVDVSEIIGQIIDPCPLSVNDSTFTRSKARSSDLKEPIVEVLEGSDTNAELLAYYGALVDLQLTTSRWPVIRGFNVMPEKRRVRLITRQLAGKTVGHLIREQGRLPIQSPTFRYLAREISLALSELQSSQASKKFNVILNLDNFFTETNGTELIVAFALFKATDAPRDLKHNLLSVLANIARLENHVELTSLVNSHSLITFASSMSLSAQEVNTVTINLRKL